MTFDLATKIWITGHKGMVGSAIARALQSNGYSHLITTTRQEVDLLSQAQVQAFYKKELPDVVIMAAAKVGGIVANNTYRADFLYENLQIQNNLIHGAYEHKIKKLLFLGSSCIYPKLALQPMSESALLTGSLEPTNEPYAIAKIAGIKLCEAYQQQYGCKFIAAMPTNLYGPNDNYHPTHSHVLPALLRRIYLAHINRETEVQLWGDGTPLREFLHVDDLATACLLLLNTYDQAAFVNVGSQQEISIAQLAAMISSIIGYTGKITYDTTKPNGTPRKLMDSSKMFAMGWSPQIPLAQGIASVYDAVKNEL